MDKNFIEFWNRYLNTSATGYSQLDEMTKWLQQGLSGSENLTSLFRQAYGLDKFSQDLPDYSKLAEEATRAFQQSLRDVLSSVGMVLKEEHMALIKKHEALKKKAADQEETIKHLRMVLDEKMASNGDGVQQFQNMLTSQNEQFQTLMNSIGQFFKPDQNHDR